MNLHQEVEAEVREIIEEIGNKFDNCNYQRFLKLFKIRSKRWFKKNNVSRMPKEIVNEIKVKASNDSGCPIWHSDIYNLSNDINDANHAECNVNYDSAGVIWFMELERIKEMI